VHAERRNRARLVLVRPPRLAPPRSRGLATGIGVRQMTATRTSEAPPRTAKQREDAERTRLWKDVGFLQWAVIVLSVSLLVVAGYAFHSNARQKDQGRQISKLEQQVATLTQQVGELKVGHP
jgi:cell division protein FtsL